MSDRPSSPLFAPAARISGFLLKWVDRAAEILVTVMFAGIVVVGGMQVFSRYVLNASLVWSEEFQRYGLIWIVFLALVIGYRRGSHIGMEFLSRNLPRACRMALGWTVDGLWLALGLAMVGFTAIYRAGAGMTFLSSVGRQRSAGMNLPMDWIYACIVAGGAYLTLAALHHLLARAAGPPSSESTRDPAC